VAEAARPGWRAFAIGGAARPFAVILGGVLLYSMNTLLTATVLPSAVAEIGGLALMSWPTAGFLAASIAAATGTGLLVSLLGRRRACVAAMLVFAAGTLLCGAAPAMAVLIAGRLLQGLGGGLLAALAYVMIRSLYPQALWPRAFALVSGMWGVSVLLGPLVGGGFANAGLWRGAFLAVAGLAAMLAALAARVLPADAGDASLAVPRFPAARIMLLLLAIAAVSLANVAATAALRGVLVAAALVALAAMLRLDRAAAAPLLPSDAFVPGTAVGAGLWMILLLSISNDPFPIYGPLFLQRLHGLDPLEAGYLVAGEAASWTVTAVAIAGLSARRVRLVLILCPLAMAAGLAGISAVMPQGPVAGLFLPIYLAGAGIGGAWAFIAQGVMSGARPREEDRAAASVVTVQQTGLALGAAIAGLIVNLCGLADAADPAAARIAAGWVPAAFALSAAAAAVMGARLSRLLRAQA
jgi:MFS family permease